MSKGDRVWLMAAAFWCGAAWLCSLVAIWLAVTVPNRVPPEIAVLQQRVDDLELRCDEYTKYLAGMSR